jgi:hypothetical protein
MSNHRGSYPRSPPAFNVAQHMVDQVMCDEVPQTNMAAGHFTNRAQLTLLWSGPCSAEAWFGTVKSDWLAMMSNHRTPSFDLFRGPTKVKKLFLARSQSAG